MIGPSRYAFLTVDVEALPKRAASDHLKKLVWGQFDNGSAGVREMCSIGNDYNVKHTFFVDLCGAYSLKEDMLQVVHWLDSNGQDVQLHAHPEVLPDVFWHQQGLSHQPALMNENLDLARAEFVLTYFGNLISNCTGKKINAFRAGSFRWNSIILDAMKNVGIPLSFNNSMRAFHSGQCVYSNPQGGPFFWSNAVIELPLTEKLIPARANRNERWVSLTYPPSNYFHYPSVVKSFFSSSLFYPSIVSVFLLHSWSFLEWDEDGHAVYRSDEKMNGYAQLLSRVSKDFDVITTQEFLDLYSRGKIKIIESVDTNLAKWKND
ncbi:polysaccharide deacetylase [Aquitalea sp. USM4]|nr:polysaccharide deacetylase [Aquitalea sp. USM4]